MNSINLLRRRVESPSGRPKRRPKRKLVPDFEFIPEVRRPRKRRKKEANSKLSKSTGTHYTVRMEQMSGEKSDHSLCGCHPVGSSYDLGYANDSKNSSPSVDCQSSKLQAPLTSQCKGNVKLAAAPSVSVFGTLKV